MATCIYGNDVLLFLCRYPKSTGHQAIGFSLQPFKGDPPLTASEREVLV